MSGSSHENTTEMKQNYELFDIFFCDFENSDFLWEHSECFWV